MECIAVMAALADFTAVTWPQDPLTKGRDGGLDWPDGVY